MMLDAKAKRKEQRRERDRLRGRLGPGRFDALVQELAGVIRLAFEAGATGSLWGLEGPLRHAIRSDLCLQGWKWKLADQMARDVLDEAFRRVNAQRPAWDEGQLEWTIKAGTLIERTRCARCGKPLPEGHRKFCDNLCAASHHKMMTLRKEADEDRTVKLAIWSLI